MLKHLSYFILLDFSHCNSYHTNQILIVMLMTVKLHIMYAYQILIIGKSYKPQEESKYVGTSVPFQYLSACITLIYFLVVVWHQIDRVILQFGLCQYILDPPHNLDKVHHTDIRGHSVVTQIGQRNINDGLQFGRKDANMY